MNTRSTVRQGLTPANVPLHSSDEGAQQSATGYGPSAQGYMDAGEMDRQSVVSYGLRGLTSYVDMKVVAVQMGSEESFPDSKIQFLSLMEQKRLLKFLEDPMYSEVLPVDHEEREAQLYTYNCLSKSLQLGKQFPVIRGASRGCAYQAWQLVKARFEPVSRLGALTLLDRLRARKLERDEDLEKYLEFVTSMITQLLTLDHRVDDMNKLLNLYGALEGTQFGTTVGLLRANEEVSYEHAVRVLRAQNQRIKLRGGGPKLTDSANQASQ